MRHLLILIWVISALVSCESQKSTPTFTEEFMLQVAGDPLFIAYQNTIHTDAENLVMNKYDMEAIGKIFDELPFGENICLSILATDKLFKVRGGSLYLTIECERNEILRELDKKFNYSSLPQEARLKIIKMYRELNYQEIKQRAFKLYHGKN